jgi:hypothetical protein
MSTYGIGRSSTCIDFASTFLLEGLCIRHIQYLEFNATSGTRRSRKACLANWSRFIHLSQCAILTTLRHHKFAKV